MTQTLLWLEDKTHGQLSIFHHALKANDHQKWLLSDFFLYNAFKDQFS